MNQKYLKETSLLTIHHAFINPYFMYCITVWGNTYQTLLDPLLTHWGRVTHICVGKTTIIGSDNGLSPGQRQAIIWTKAGIMLIGTLGTNFSEIWIECHSFSFQKMHMKMSSGKWRPSCLGLNVLKLQRRSVRPVIGAGRYDHTFPIFQKLNILNLKNMYLYSLLILLYRYNQQILPESFSEFFRFNNDVHGYQTRQQYDFHTPSSICFQRSKTLEALV